MHIKRNLSIAALAALVGIPALSSINANASEAQFGNKPAVSNPSRVHVVSRTNQGINFKVDGDPQEQEANYGSPLERQIDQSNQNNNSSSNSTQYANKNSLPQTGEVSHQSSALAASIVLGSIGVGAAAMDKKHNQLD